MSSLNLLDLQTYAQSFLPKTLQARGAPSRSLRSALLEASGIDAPGSVLKYSYMSQRAVTSTIFMWRRKVAHQSRTQRRVPHVVHKIQSSPRSQLLEMDTIGSSTLGPTVGSTQSPLSRNHQHILAGFDFVCDYHLCVLHLAFFLLGVFACTSQNLWARCCMDRS